MLYIHSPGFIQLIGCLGALRLSERLLNAYWMLLLTLLLGDAMIGVFWFFKFERILGELTPTLKHRLSTEYGVLADFTELWDRLQSETRCCGLMGQVIIYFVCLVVCAHILPLNCNLLMKYLTLTNRRTSSQRLTAHTRRRVALLI